MENERGNTNHPKTLGPSRVGPLLRSITQCQSRAFSIWPYKLTCLKRGTRIRKVTRIDQTAHIEEIVCIEQTGVIKEHVDKTINRCENNPPEGGTTGIHLNRFFKIKHTLNNQLCTKDTDIDVYEISELAKNQDFSVNNRRGFVKSGNTRPNNMMLWSRIVRLFELLFR